MMMMMMHYLVDQKIKQNQRDRQQQRRQSQKYYLTTTEITVGTISWIEKLLTMPIADYRKYCIWHILAPYLINVRKLQDSEATDTLREWLKRCNPVKRVSFDDTSRIRYNIQSVRKHGFYPIGWNQLKTDNVALYNLLELD
jgi:Primase X